MSKYTTMTEIIKQRRYAGKLNQLSTNKYVIAQQYRHNDIDKYRYYGFYDKNQFIRAFVKYPNQELFELLNDDITKVYFDLDMKDDKTLTRYEADIIINKLINWINIYFNEKITIDDLIILTRDEEQIKSLHIILYKRNINKFNCKEFVKNYLPYEELHIDCKVYTKNRNFCFKNQTKVKYEKKRLLTDYYKNQEKPISYYSCKIIDDTTPLKKSPLINWWEDIKKQSIKNVILNTDTKKLIKKMKKKMFQPNPNNKSTIKVNKYTLINELINLLPKEFYLNAGDWIMISKQLIWNDIDNINKWLEYSSDMSNDTYSYDKNLEWKDNLPQSEFINETSFINNCILKLNDKYNLKLHYKNINIYDTKELRLWLSEKTEESIEVINDVFINGEFTSLNDKIPINQDWILYQKTLTLTNGDIQLNYWKDEFYTKAQNEDIEKYKHLSRLEIQNEEIPKFMEDENKKLMGVCMKWGMGKTHYCMKEAIKIALKNDWNILIITENNALNKETYKTLKLIYGDYIVCNHLSLKKNNFEEYHKICITSQESIKKTNGKVFQLIILDEYESLLNHYESTTFKRTTDFQSIQILESKCKKSNKIICLDADLSLRRLTPLTEILEIENPILLYSNENKWEDYKFNIYTDNESLFYDNIFNDIKDNKNITIGFQSKTKTDIFEELLLTEYPKMNVLKITSDGNFLNGDGEDLNLTENLDEYIESNDINIFIHSPSVKTGISINLENYFHKTYLLTNIMSCCGREALQMLFRVRNPIDKELNIHLPKLYNPIPRPTDKQIINYLVNNSSLPYFNNIENLNKSSIGDDFKLSPLYEKIKVNNIIETWRSLNNLPHEILHKLTINHNIKVNFVNEGICENHEDLIKNYKNEVLLKRILELQSLPLIPKKTKREMEKRTHKKLGSIKEIRLVKKRLLINKLGFNHGHQYKKNGEFIERVEKMGGEYYYDLNKIKYSPFGYDNISHKNLNVISDLLIKDNNQKEIHFINYIQNQDIPNEETFNEDWEQSLNQQNQKNNKFKINYYIIKSLLPQIFSNQNGKVKINLINQEISVKDFKNQVFFMSEEIIKKSFNFWYEVKNINNKFNFENYNPTNIKHQKHIYNCLNQELKLIGIDLTAPKNKSRDNEKYKLNPVEYIYYEKNHERNFPEKIIVLNKENDEKELTINKKTQKIKIKPKIQKEKYHSKEVINLFPRENSNNIKNYEVKVPNIQTIKIDNINFKDFHKKTLNSIPEDTQFYSRYRPKIPQDQELINEFYSIYHKRPRPNQEKVCLILEDDELNHKYTQKTDPLNKNIDYSESDDEEEEENE